MGGTLTIRHDRSASASTALRRVERGWWMGRVGHVVGS